MAKTLNPVRGEIYIVRLDPTEGAEEGKTRPSLILQNDTANRTSPITIVAAITSKFNPAKLYPTEVLIKAGEGGLTIDSVALLNQIRSIDKVRLISLVGSIEPQTMLQVERAIKVSFGLFKPAAKI
jgi:mRNA interferase MazF